MPKQSYKFLCAHMLGGNLVDMRIRGGKDLKCTLSGRLWKQSDGGGIVNAIEYLMKEPKNQAVFEKTGSNEEMKIVNITGLPLDIGEELW